MSKKKELTFDSALSKLEKSVRRLEEGDIDLDKFVDIFVEGVKNAAFCQHKLDEARQKIEVVLKEFEGATEKLKPIDESEIFGDE